MSKAIQEFKTILSDLVSTIQSNTDARSLINRWIDDKYGKIIGWKVRESDREENFHLIFTSNDAHFHVGEYPAFDVMILGNIDEILDLLKGIRHLNSELKRRNVMVWGNLNDGLNFEKNFRKIMQLEGK
ncbi:MAG: hypothetical protein ACTSRS_12135 [Candidatus Helarchaeota archaeon]